MDVSNDLWISINEFFVHIKTYDKSGKVVESSVSVKVVGGYVGIRGRY